MPLDYKRFNGPEDSVPYKCYTKDFIKNYEELSKELVNKDGKRKDGRALDEVGRMCMSYNNDMIWACHSLEALSSIPRLKEVD